MVTNSSSVMRDTVSCFMMEVWFIIILKYRWVTARGLLGIKKIFNVIDKDRSIWAIVYVSNWNCKINYCRGPTKFGPRTSWVLIRPMSFVQDVVVGIFWYHGKMWPSSKLYPFWAVHEDQSIYLRMTVQTV